MSSIIFSGAHSRPHIVLRDFEKRSKFVIEFPAPAEKNITAMENENNETYKDHMRELRRLNKNILFSSSSWSPVLLEVHETFARPSYWDHSRLLPPISRSSGKCITPFWCLIFKSPIKESRYWNLLPAASWQKNARKFKKNVEHQALSKELSFAFPRSSRRNSGFYFRVSFQRARMVSCPP